METRPAPTTDPASHLQDESEPAELFDRSAHRMEPMDPQPLVSGQCDHCGKRTKRGQAYCSKPCRVAYNNILARQGKAVIQILKIWRKHRGGKGTAGEGKLSLAAKRVDAILSEDRARKAHFARARLTAPD